jgi:probable HAF family extracellular repeat protein
VDVRERVIGCVFICAIVSGCTPESGGTNAVVPTYSRVATGSGSGYTVAVLPSLGGTNSAANTINERGWPMGTSFLSGNTIMHAALWRGRKATDLGTLGGPNSAVEWPVENDRGYVAGISETSRKDPLGESTSWSCHAFLPDNGSSGDTCLAFVWYAGHMRRLPTLGGNNGYGAGMNEGEIAGWAETKRHDPTCVAPQVLQFLPTVWNAMTRAVTALPTVTVDGKTDPDGAATAVNHKGEVVGISGLCYEAVGSFSARHAVLWKEGRPIRLKTLGGLSWNTPVAINDQGEIAGFLNERGSADRHGNPNFISVVWTNPHMKPTIIGALPGDQLSEPTSINNEGAVIGVSFPSGHVYLWQNGSMTDLTQLVLQSYPQLQLVSVGGINDSGQIAGQACELVSGSCPPSGATFVTFLATPN